MKIAAAILGHTLIVIIIPICFLHALLHVALWDLMGLADKLTGYSEQ